MLLLEVVEPVAFDAQVALFLSSSFVPEVCCFVLVFASGVHGQLSLGQAGTSLGCC